MTLGALVHDFGHILQKIDYAKPLSQLTPEDLVVFKQHPMIGAQKIKDLRHFDQTVVQIILEHEETMDGSGYPHKLSGNKINIFSMIVGTANAFDRMMTFENRTPADAMKNLMIDKVGQYPLDYLKTLKVILAEQGLMT